MADNRHLVPMCIVYANGVRIPADYEAAFTRVLVVDKMNGISSFVLDFEAYIGQLDLSFFGFQDKISILLGYYGDLSEVFSGDVVQLKTKSLGKGRFELEVIGKNMLYLMKATNHYRHFENRSASDAIKEIVEMKYNLQPKIDKFGMVCESWGTGDMTDLELILMLAGRYGKEVYCYGDTVYVTGLMTFRTDFITYEWGKNLISFRLKEDIKNQISKQKMVGWDVQRCKAIKVEKTIDDIDTKIGGRNSWETVSNGGGGKWVDVQRIDGKTDISDAWEQAKGKLQKSSYEYIRAEASAEGNPKLFAGMTVTMKNIGKRYNGEYMTEWVAHEFSQEDGFITEFGLKRNMLNDDNVPRRAVIEQSAVAHMAAINAANEEAANQENEEEEERNPQFSNLRWEKDGKTIDTALVDDEVTICFDVQDINNDETITIQIWEHDDDGEHDHVADVTGTVENGKICINWKVIYVEDNDDSDSAQELKEKGYTLPEYHFVAKYGGVVSEESGVMEINDWIYKQLVDEDNQVFVNTRYILHLPDNSTIQGVTDNSGYMKEKHNIPFVSLEISIGEE